MTATLMERITGRRRAAEQKTIDSYHQLVVAVADDPESVDPARADAILLDAAKRPEQLAADVETLKQRRIDAEIAERLPGLRQRAEELSNSCISLREVLAAATKKYQADAIELDRQMRFNARDIAEAEAAARRLRAGRPDARLPDLIKERDALKLQRAELVQQIGENNATGLRGRAHKLMTTLKHPPITMDALNGIINDAMPHIAMGSAFDPSLVRDALAITQTEAKNLEAKLPPIDSRLAVVNGELADIERRQLTP